MAEDNKFWIGDLYNLKTNPAKPGRTGDQYREDDHYDSKSQCPNLHAIPDRDHEQNGKLKVLI